MAEFWSVMKKFFETFLPYHGTPGKKLLSCFHQNPPECVTPFRVTRKPILVRIRDLRSPWHFPKSAALKPVVLEDSNRRN
jgi:hypothetical protein